MIAMVEFKKNSSSFVIILIVNPAGRSTIGSSAKVISEKIPCTTRERQKSSFVAYLLLSVLNQLRQCLGVTLLDIYQQLPTLHFRFLLSLNSNFSSLTLMSHSSTGFATKANLSGIAESRISIDQPAPTLPIHNSTSCRTNLLDSSLRIAGIDKPILHWEVASMRPQLTIGEPDV